MPKSGEKSHQLKSDKLQKIGNKQEDNSLAFLQHPTFHILQYMEESSANLNMVY